HPRQATAGEERVGGRQLGGDDDEVVAVRRPGIGANTAVARRQASVLAGLGIDQPQPIVLDVFFDTYPVALLFLVLLFRLGFGIAHDERDVATIGRPARLADL